MKILVFLLLVVGWSYGQSESDLSRMADHIDFLNGASGSGVIDFTPHGTQPGLTHGIVPAGNCAQCHGVDPGTPEDAEYAPSATWWGSMKANSLRDPLFWAAVDIANQDAPGVGDYCIRCHSPTAFYAGNTKDGTGDLDFANGCKVNGTLNQAQENGNNDFQGVTCHFCHRIDEQGPNNENFITQNANVWLDDQVCDNPNSTSNEPCRKGPYDPPLSQLHAWEYSELIQQGKFCGSCHDVTSPEISVDGQMQFAQTLIDENGVDTGLAMPIERTYSEWTSSLFSDLIFTDGLGGDVATTFPNPVTGQSCQDCHMPNSEHPGARASWYTAPGSRTGNLKIHEFAGGNSWMPQVLKAAYGSDLNLPGQNINREAAFDRSTAAALDMLQNKSALLNVSTIAATANEAQVRVKVTNLTGHKLPTGYPEGRRMWLNIQVKDVNQTLIYESGAYNSITAELNQDADIQIYETKPGIWDDESNTCVVADETGPLFHFVKNNCVAKDNRIPPLGFRGASSVEMKPIGANYPADPNNPDVSVNYDEKDYTFTVPQGVSYPLNVVVTLKYQTASKDYIDFLDSKSTMPSENDLCADRPPQAVGPADQSRGAYMKTLWEDHGKSAPVDMVTAEYVLSLIN